MSSQKCSYFHRFGCCSSIMTCLSYIIGLYSGIIPQILNVFPMVYTILISYCVCTAAWHLLPVCCYGGDDHPHGVTSYHMISSAACLLLWRWWSSPWCHSLSHDIICCLPVCCYGGDDHPHGVTAYHMISSAACLLLWRWWSSPWCHSLSHDIICCLSVVMEVMIIPLVSQLITWYHLLPACCYGGDDHPPGVTAYHMISSAACLLLWRWWSSPWCHSLSHHIICCLSAVMEVMIIPMVSQLITWYHLLPVCCYGGDDHPHGVTSYHMISSAACLLLWRWWSSPWCHSLSHDIICCLSVGMEVMIIPMVSQLITWYLSYGCLRCSKFSGKLLANCTCLIEDVVNNSQLFLHLFQDYFTDCIT